MWHCSNCIVNVYGENCHLCGRPMPPDSVRTAPAAPAEAKEGAMKCPQCFGEMQPGKLAVHGTFIGFLFVGWSYQHCWWQPAGDSGQEVEFVSSNGSRVAHRCEKCRMVLVPDF